MADSLSDGGSSSYYDIPPNCKGLTDVIVAKEMGYSQGNIVKAAYRWAVKPNLTYNIKKIIWFAVHTFVRIDAEACINYLQAILESIYADMRPRDDES